MWRVDAGAARVSAAQLQHRVPCWGYVFDEVPGAAGVEPAADAAAAGEEATGAASGRQRVKGLLLGRAKAPKAGAAPAAISSSSSVGGGGGQQQQQGRKVVVLGDTIDSRAIGPIAYAADVICHEATFAQVCCVPAAGQAGRQHPVASSLLGRAQQAWASRPPGNQAPAPPPHLPGCPRLPTAPRAWRTSAAWRSTAPPGWRASLRAPLRPSSWCSRTSAPGALPARNPPARPCTALSVRAPAARAGCPASGPSVRPSVRPSPAPRSPLPRACCCRYDGGGGRGRPGPNSEPLTAEEEEEVQQRAIHWLLKEVRLRRRRRRCRRRRRVPGAAAWPAGAAQATPPHSPSARARAGGSLAFSRARRLHAGSSTLRRPCRLP